MKLPAEPARRRLWLAGLGMATLLLLFLAVSWVARSSLSNARLEALLDDAVSGASGGFYEVTVADSSVELLRRGLVLEGLSIRAAPDRADVPVPAVRFDVVVDRAQVRGVSLFRLLTRSGLRAAEVAVSGSRIEAEIHQPTNPGAQPPPAEGPAIPAEQIREALAGIPEVRLGRVDVQNIQVHTRRTVGADTSVWELDDLDVEIDDLHIHEGASEEEIRALFSDDLRLLAHGLELTLNTGARVGVQRLEVGSRAERLALFDAQLTPAQSAQQYLQRSDVSEPDRIEAHIDELAIDAFAPWSFITNLTVELGEVRLTGFRLAILHDRHKPQPPSRRPAVQPHEALQRIGVPFRVARVELADGQVLYSERAPEVERAGSITFADVAGTISEVTAPPKPDSTTIIELKTSVERVAPATVRLELPLAAGGPSMRSEGRVGGFEATVLNSILVPLEGLEIRRGSVEQVTFSVDYTPEHATGTVTAQYRDLGIRLVNKDTGEPNLGQRIVSIAAGLAVHGSNGVDPGSPPRIARVDYPVNPSEPFFKLFWEPVRDGLLHIMRR